MGRWDAEWCLVFRGQVAGRTATSCMRKSVPTMWMMVLAMSLTACGPAPKPSVPAEVPETDAGDSIRKKPGETFTVELDSNPSTGYRWALDGKEDATVVKKLSDEFVSRPHPPGMVGVGGTERWKFQVVKPGKTALHFTCRRPFEKDAEPARERTINVLIE